MSQTDISDTEDSYQRPCPSIEDKLDLRIHLNRTVNRVWSTRQLFVKGIKLTVAFNCEIKLRMKSLTPTGEFFVFASVITGSITDEG